MAGSIPFLSKIIGTKVPTRAATIITKSIEMAMVNATCWSICVRAPNKITNTPRARPFIRARPTSLSSLLNKLPFTLSLAKPCTIIALDCTPTFPAIAAIRGVKKNSSTWVARASSKPLIIYTLPRPPKSPSTSQGKRALVRSIMLSSASTS